MVSEEKSSNLNNTIKGSSIYHAVLLEKNGLMSELWLPITIGGKYVFSAANGQIAIVSGSDHFWIATISGNGFFFDVDGTQKKEMILSNSMLLPSVVAGRKYSLYFEETNTSSNTYIPFYCERNVDIVIGRATDSDICYSNDYVTRHHAFIRWNGDKWTIKNNNSTNGVYVNGQDIVNCDLSLGDNIYIMGLNIIVGAGFISMNQVNDKISILSPKVRPICNDNDVEYADCSADISPIYYDRKPRKKYKLDSRSIEIDMPPAPISKNKIPLFLRLGSSAVMGGQAIFSGNYLSALTSMVFPSLTQGLTEKERKDYETKRVERYRQYLKSKANEIDTEIRFEEIFLRDQFPDFRDTLSAANNRSRLWDRRKIDDDFLTVRIGNGTIPMFADKQYAPKKFELEPDFLLDEMYELTEKASLLHDVPITVSLKEDYVLGITGTICKTLKLIIQMIASLAVTHSYDELKIVILAPPETREALEIFKYLPHLWDNEKSIRFFATNSTDTQAVVKYLSNIWNSNREKSGNSLKTELKKQAAYVIFALDKVLFDCSEFFRDLLFNDTYCGFSVVAAFNNVPKECSKLIDLRSNNLLVDLSRPDIEDRAFSIDDYENALLIRSISQLSKTKLRIENESEFVLPNSYSFLEMYGVGKVEHLNPLARWSENNPVMSLSVPIGVGTDGNLFTLDLHEKRQGPHGLVAGMTGSGKSEFLITYILSLAVNFSPDEVAFILIDYKGGGLADAFVNSDKGIHLPHVVATITNLDGASIQRSLVSIQSELNHRQKVFKKAKSDTNEGTMDIYDYQRLYRNKKVSEPMPHLFIISDEFAELKKQQPEFMDALISAARIGRSLGIHLILATQKPGGVVNDQIWSNTKFRACLRVQDRSDSMEMLKRPEAAELNTTGRFYLQVGYNEYFALGQSAWCGAGYFPQDEVIVQRDNAVEFVDEAGQVILKTTPPKKDQKAESKQIVAIVRYLSDLSKYERIVPKNLWCPALQKKLDYNELLMHEIPTEEQGVSALIGMVDDPENQTQFPLLLNLQSFHHMLLCGEAGSGKSTFLRTMLYSLIMRYTPEEINYYILDLSNGALSDYRATPYCGAYLTNEDETEFDRLLTMIRSMIAERKKQFDEIGVYSFDAFIKRKKMPLVLFMIDSWMNISSFKKGQEYGLTLNSYMREAANYGIKFILTINHISETTAKIKQEVDYHIALRAKDKFDYNDILNIRGASVPPEIPGRGVCVIEKRPLEYQVAVPNCTKDEHEQIIILREMLSKRTDEVLSYPAAARLPVIDNTLEYDTFCDTISTGRIPLGLSMDMVVPTAIPLQQLYTTSIYFGNPIGVRPVISNFLAAFSRENADVFLVRRITGTIFDREMNKLVQSLFPNRSKYYDCSPDDFDALYTAIVENIQTTKMPYRDAYCKANGISAKDQGRTKKAGRYIRQNTTPLFVFFESFTDFLGTEISKDLKTEFSNLFSKIKGYNVYFFGCFFPENENAASNPVFRAFSQEDFAMLFGGVFQKEWITAISPELKRMEKVNPNYNRFILKYHNECYRMHMPCGTLISNENDPDEADIIS